MFVRSSQSKRRHEPSYSNISKTVYPRITQFHMDTRTDIVYSLAEHDLIIYLRKYRLRRLLVELLKKGLS